MPLKHHSDLLFYSEIADDEDSPIPTHEFFVGLYRDAALQPILKCESSRFVRFGRWMLARRLEKPAPVFVAAALVRHQSGALVIRNVGALPGYGPLLYASVLHLARARGHIGVIPSSDPSKILAKPKKIWLRFATGEDYVDKVAVLPFDGLHAEPWLNMIHNLNPDQDLFAFHVMRRKARAYWRFWQSRDIEPSLLAYPARKMAERSVQAGPSRSSRNGCRMTQAPRL